MTASPEPPQEPPKPQPQAQRRRHGSALDRLLAMGFVAFFLYLLYLAMTSQLDDQVNLFASWLRGLFT